MTDKHITYFKVENFKCFEILELKNIAQFNLITGANSIGKTTLLEALLFDEDAEIFAENLYTALIYRFQFSPTQTDFLSYFTQKDSEKDIRFVFANDKKITIKHNKEQKSTSSNNAPISLRVSENKDVLYLKPTNHVRDIPLIYYANFFDNNLTDLYSKHIQNNRSRKQTLISALNRILPTLEFIEVSTSATDYPTLVVTQENFDSVIPLAMLGSGVVKLTRILIEIIAHSEKRIMIDEIGADIEEHRLNDFWRVILWFCQEYEVQLFASTQNQKCLQVFREVLQESEEDWLQNTRIFYLKVSENQEVIAETEIFDVPEKIEETTPFQELNHNHSVEIQGESV